MVTIHSLYVVIKSSLWCNTTMFKFFNIYKMNPTNTKSFGQSMASMVCAHTPYCNIKPLWTSLIKSDNTNHHLLYVLDSLLFKLCSTLEKKERVYSSLFHQRPHRQKCQQWFLIMVKRIKFLRYIFHYYLSQ